MKKILFSSIIFPLLMIASCAPAPTVQRVIITPSETPTLVPTETQTPIPTETPAPIIPPETQALFDQAGIDLKDMANATFDKDGLHINLPSGEVVDVATENLNNFVNYKNDVAHEEEHFLPVWNSETKESTLYTFDKESRTWSLSETLKPLELSTDPNKIGKCTYKDVISGHLNESLKTLDITFPADAINTGWKSREGGSTSELVLKPDSKKAMQLLSVCKISDEFLGLSEQSYVASVAVLNPDSTIGFINFFLYNKSGKNGLNDFLKAIKGSDGYNVALVRKLYEVEKYWNDPTWRIASRIYRTQGDSKVMTALNKMELDGNIPVEMKRLLIMPIAVSR